MYIDFFVDGKPVQFRRDSFAGKAVVESNEGIIVLQNPLNPFTHFSLKQVRTWHCTVSGDEVVIEKTRPLLLAAFRPSKYRILVNRKLVAEKEG
jgi:hypothetical protein